MSTNVGSIHYDLTLNTKGFEAEMKKVGTMLSDIGDKMQNVGKTMTTFVTLPIVAGAAASIKAASNLQETINKVNVSFADQAETVKEWGKTSIKTMGLAQESALNAAATFGDMSTSMGLNTEEAMKMSTGLVRLGADMASFKNISFERAQVALAGVYTGETEALKSLGIVMTQTNLAEFAMRQGITKSIDEMTQAEKVQLRYAYVMSVTTNAQGDFARTSTSTANKIRTVQERFKELSTTIGEELQPYADKLLSWVEKMIDAFEKLEPQQKTNALRFTGIAASIGPLLIVLGKLSTSIGSLIPLMGNPAFWIIIGVLAAIGAIAYVVYQNWDKIKTKLEELRPIWDWTKEKIELIWKVFQDKILPIFRQVWDFIINNFKQAWESLKDSVMKLEAQLNEMGISLEDLAKSGIMAVIIMLATFVVSVMAAISALVAIISVLARVSAALLEVQTTIRGWVQTAIGHISHGYSVIVNYLEGLRSAFWSAGYNFLISLGNGIYAGIQYAVNAIRHGLNIIRSFLPFSPAKQGPFSGKGWTLYSGMSMMEGLADGIKSMSVAPKMAMDKAMATVQNNETTNYKTINQGVNIYGNIKLENNNADNFFGLLSETQVLADYGLSPVEARV